MNVNELSSLSLNSDKSLRSQYFQQAQNLRHLSRECYEKWLSTTVKPYCSESEGTCQNHALDQGFSCCQHLTVEIRLETKIYIYN